MGKEKIEEIRKRAKSSGVYNRMSVDDWERITDPNDLGQLVEYTLDRAIAVSDEERSLADTGAQRIRAKYGYTRTEDGTVEELRPDYEGSEFVFRPERNEAYREAMKQYSKSGSDAAVDTLYTLAGNTNGEPSSYAKTAAESARRKENEKLSSLLSDLYDEEYKAFRARKTQEAAELAAKNKQQKETAKKAQQELTAIRKQAEKEAAAREKAEKQAAAAQAKVQKANAAAQEKAAQKSTQSKTTGSPASERTATESTYENAPGKLYADPKRTATGGSEPLVYYANVLQKMVRAGATNKQIRAYLKKLATDGDGLTLQDRAMLIPAFWNVGRR